MLLLHHQPHMTMLQPVWSEVKGGSRLFCSRDRETSFEDWLAIRNMEKVNEKGEWSK